MQDRQTEHGSSVFSGASAPSRPDTPDVEWVAEEFRKARSGKVYRVGVRRRLGAGERRECYWCGNVVRVMDTIILSQNGGREANKQVFICRKCEPLVEKAVLEKWDAMYEFDGSGTLVYRGVPQTRTVEGGLAMVENGKLAKKMAESFVADVIRVADQPEETLEKAEGPAPDMVRIYGLVDPESGEYRYVGRTTWRPIVRLCAHVIESVARVDRQAAESADRVPDLCRWVYGLVEKDKMPEIRVLEEFKLSERRSMYIAEQYWSDKIGVTTTLFDPLHDAAHDVHDGHDEPNRGDGGE